MQLYVQAARQLMAEIEQTETRLSELRAALQGIAPLVTPHELQAALPNGSSRRVLRDVQDVVDMHPAPSALAAPVVDASTSPAAETLATRASREPKKKRAARKSVRKSVRVAQAARTSKPPAALPATGSAFWLETMGKRRHTVAELVTKAIGKLALDEAARPVLMNRASAWLYPALKSGALRHGAERDGLKTYQVA